MRVPGNATLLLTGWAARPTAEPAFDLQCRVDGNATGTVYPQFREDVGKQFNKSSMCSSGFHVAVDTSALAPGPHEMSLSFDAGAYTLPAIPFTVTAPTRARHSIVESTRYALEISAFHSDITPEAKSYRVERPAAAIVRGTLTDARGRGVPEALYGIVDEFDVYPARVDPSDASFLLCLLSRTLTLGDHVLRLAVKPRGESVLELLPPIRFAVTPLSTAIVFRRPDPSTAVASCSWASDPSTTEPVGANARSFARGALAHVRGWAFDTATADALKDVHLCFDNGTQFRMDARQLREDVARKYGVPKARFCGFVGTIAVDALAPGRNVGRIFAVAKDEVTLLSTEAIVEIDCERVTVEASGSRAL